MKKSFAFLSSVVALGMFALVGCDSDNGTKADDTPSSSSKAPDSAASDEFDCSVTKGVVVVSPKGGETFKIGDKVKVVFGVDIVDASYAVEYRVTEDDFGYPLKFRLDDGKFQTGSIHDKDVVVDGKTCNTVEVILDADVVEASDEAVIIVRPYNEKGTGKSGKIKVEE